MAIHFSVINRLNDVVKEQSLGKERTLIFFKGFNAEFYNEVAQRLPALHHKSWINATGYIDVLALEREIKDLTIGFLTNQDKILWGFYEEFIALSDSLNSLQQHFDGNLVIVSNNLFSKYYPLDFESERKEALYDYFNEEALVENHQNEKLAKYYSNAVKLSENLIALSFVNRHIDEDIMEINFFPSIAVKAEDICEEFAAISVHDARFELFKVQLQQGHVYEKVQLTIEDEQDKKQVAPVWWLCSQAGMNVTVCHHNKFRELAKQDENQYLHLLKQYWGAGCGFRLLNFYKNPDESKEQITISQGHIISDIIEQSEFALKGNADFSDIFITAPTGAGKSLLFQIPAIHLNIQWQAITLVITPLIALMRDQVTNLIEENGVDFATFINSDITFDEKERRIASIKNGEISIVYLSPELLLANSVESIIGDRKIGLLVIDEAHLVTTWGRDFRADYWYIGSYIEKLRNIRKNIFPILCLTATAVYMGNEDMVLDTQASLNLKNCKLYLGNVRRDNISFEIKKLSREDNYKSIDELKINVTKKRIGEFVHKNIKSIVYCPYTAQVDDVHAALDEECRSYVGKYYGSYGKFEKNDSYEKFKYGEFKSMICTKAFGMGVDISDIELVYHYAPTGNLADYVQEIGRGARHKDIDGIAMTDFTDKDLKYVRMLHGLSRIKQYQIREVLRKIYQIYKEKNSRNFLIAPDAFSYLFDDREIENKVKSGLLLISQDLENRYGFPVINVRPKSLFTKNFVNIPPEVEIEFLNEFGQYSQAIPNVPVRIIPGYGKVCDTMVTNSGRIYEMNMAQVWENNFSFLTFAQFKRDFFQGKLFQFANQQNISPRVNVILHYNDDYLAVAESLRDSAKKLTKVFSRLKNRGEVFTKVQFKEEYKATFDGTLRSSDLPNLILDLFVADISQNIGFNQNCDKLKFIQERQAHNRDERVYRIMNSNYTMLTGYLSRLFSQCCPNIADNSYSVYIAVTPDKKRPELVFLAVMLELFGLASYEIIGGKNTEIFVRVNDPLKVRRLSLKNYTNIILTEIERKQERSQKVLMEFLKKDLSNEERWDIIEDYFLGRDDIVSQILEI
ncbi:MAG: helicase-related protein [Sporomusaceae bacterium]|nr:helicase-related protein [Sporomusaceae bacterium]